MNLVKEYENGWRVFVNAEEYCLNFTFVDQGDDDDDYSIRGSVKWDGCINWETSPNCMYHFCEPAHADHLAQMFKDVWREAALRIPKWDAATLPVKEG